MKYMLMKNIVIPVPMPIPTGGSCGADSAMPEWVRYTLIGCGLLAFSTIVGVMIYWWRNG